MKVVHSIKKSVLCKFAIVFIKEITWLSVNTVMVFKFIIKP